MLEAFAEVTDGFYWQALEETSAQNLRDFSAAWNAFRGSSEGQEFPSWSSAITSLFDRQSETLVVLCQFGYLLDVAPEVPSLIQARLTPREGRIVVTEDPTLADRALYWGILAALAEGKGRRSDLAEALGRTPTSIGFPTKVLTGGRW